MKKKFISNLIFLIFINVIVKAIYVFKIDLSVQNEVGPEIYGSYFALFNTALIFQIILDLGIENFIRREISQYPILINRYLPNIIILKVVLAIPYAAICFALALMMKVRAGEFPLLIMILLNQFLASFILSMRSHLGGLQLFKAEGIISVLDRLMLIIIVGYLLLKPETADSFKIMWFVLAQTLAYTVTLVVCLVLIFRNTAFSQFQFDIRIMVPIIKKLRPYALLVLLMMIYTRIDSLLLKTLLPDGNKEAGIYAHAYRFIDFMSNYALLFPVLLLPIFSKSIRLKIPTSGLLKLAILLLIVPSLAVIIPSIIFRYEIFMFFYRESPGLSADVYAWLIVSYLGTCIAYTFGALLTANGNLKQLNFMAAGAVVISISLNILLIPRFNVYGAAIANAASQLFTIIFHIFLVVKIFRYSLNYAVIARLAGFIIAMFLAGIWLKTTGINWIAGMIVLAFAGLLLAFILKLVRLKDIFIMIMQKNDAGPAE